MLLSHLAVVHSYVLVKPKVQAEEHVDAARLLIRVCANISRFQKHAAQILISAVIECQRAGLHQSAFQLASTLAQPEHREGLESMAQHRRQIETIVRAYRVPPYQLHARARASRARVSRDASAAAASRRRPRSDVRADPRRFGSRRARRSHPSPCAAAAAAARRGLPTRWSAPAA